MEEAEEKEMAERVLRRAGSGPAGWRWRWFSGEQRLDLLGGPRHQVLQVLVGVGGAADGQVDLPVGPTHQLSGLAKDLVPGTRAQR